MSLLDICLVVVAYLVGAIPFGMVVARLFGGADLRSRGSGNIGATNAARVLGKKAGAATLLCDVLKGFFPVLAALHWGSQGELALWAAAAAVIGHVFPVYLKFRGGKGVATGFGVLMALHFPTALIAFVIWVASAKLSGVSAVGALAAYGTLPVVAGLQGPGGGFFPLSVGISLLVLIRHKDNVRKLLDERRQ